MLINRLTILLLIFISGCQSTKQPESADCQYGVSLSFSPELTSQAYINYADVKKFIIEHYQAPNLKLLNIELVKAHITTRATSIRATVVIKTALPQKSYFRGTEVDVNMIGSHSEYQSAIHKALLKAVDQFLMTQHKVFCSN